MLTVVTAQGVQQARTGVAQAGGMAVMGGAAVVGGVAVGCVLGSTAAVIGAGGAAYAATRSDDVGDGTVPFHNIPHPS